MDFDVAKAAVDYILGNPQEFPEDAVVFEFIGGELLLEIELIDQISDYIKCEMYRLDHKWFYYYIFFIYSKGLLYDASKVQAYIRKNREHVGVSITLDGNQVKHDLSRKKVDGSESYEEGLSNVRLWQKQFVVDSTKSTFAHADLPHHFDSVISLWNNGIKIIAANVVFKDVWYLEDPDILEAQLKKLAD